MATYYYSFSTDYTDTSTDSFTDGWGYMTEMKVENNNGWDAPNNKGS